MVISNYKFNMNALTVKIFVADILLEAVNHSQSSKFWNQLICSEKYWTVVDNVLTNIPKLIKL